nr:DNA methyltransferase [Anaerolineaceae bacterium]
MTDSGAANTLFFGDNLAILRERVIDNSVDLVYLDAPFNPSHTSYTFVKSESGQDSVSPIESTGDSWHWNAGTEEVFQAIISSGPQPVALALGSFLQSIGKNPMMASLATMAACLIELHRVLKPTGSLYLHCDPSASHYLKVVLDTIFGVEHFGNEIVWQRTNAKGLAFTRFASNHDILLRYTKTNHWTWNPQFTPLDPAYVEKFYRFVEPGTKRRYQLADLTNPNPDRPNLTYEFLGVKRVWRWTQKRMQAAYDNGLIVQSLPGRVPRLKRYLDEQKGNSI